MESKLLANGHNGEYWLAVSKVDRSEVVIKKPAAKITKITSTWFAVEPSAPRGSMLYNTVYFLDLSHIIY